MCVLVVVCLFMCMLDRLIPEIACYAFLQRQILIKSNGFIVCEDPEDPALDEGS